MRDSKLGRTGRFVSELCLGTTAFGGGGGLGETNGPRAAFDFPPVAGEFPAYLRAQSK